MPRSRTLALLGAGLLGVGGLAARNWPSSEAGLDCPPGTLLEVVPEDGQQRASCVPTSLSGHGAPLPAGAAMTLGQRLDLNRVAPAELGLVPGIGPKLAAAIVAYREELGGFRTWEQVDQVSGMGPSKLATLQAAAEIRE